LGNNLSIPISVGQQSAQAAHPHMIKNQQFLDIVWTEFSGTEHQLWHQRSTDNGKSFSNAEKLATTTEGSDRPFIIKKSGVSYVSWQRPADGHWFKAL